MTQAGEEAAEMVSTIRGEHVAMKTWFHGASLEAVALRAKFGDYPGLWKEVLNWKGWKETRRAYLADQQRNENAATSVKMGETPSETTNGYDATAPRKRKSRWGTVTTEEAPRKSRWEKPPEVNTTTTFPAISSPVQPVISPRPSLPALPGLPSNLNPQQQQMLTQYQSRLREVNEKLAVVEQEAARVDALPRNHRERSPSPPPVYGPDGKRKNTRAVRWRDRYTAERQDLLEKLMSLNPSVRNNSLFRRKRTNRVPIPIEKHPNYNFIGLIIGPRGKTQKELEAKTGCKIAIRGKGSVKEGARGRRDGKVMDGDDEPLHVVITGDDQGSVDAATDMIQQMLVVIDDEKNVHKQAQLRELALLNGTLKEDEFCPICAEKGHRAFECPKRFSSQNNKNKIQIRCAICGDTSHPTRDCTQKIKPELAEGAGMKNKQELDSDYADFMAELDGKKSEPVKQEKISPPISTAATAEQPVGITILKPAVSIPATQGTIPPPTLLPPPPVPPSLPPPPPTVVPAFSAFPPPIPAGSAVPLPPPVSVPYGGYMPPQVQIHPPPTTVPTGYSQGYDANAYYSQGGQSQHVEQHQYLQAYHQQPPPPQMQQAPPAVQDETEGWDYQSYYGQQNNGAGGFNWWEQT